MTAAMNIWWSVGIFVAATWLIRHFILSLVLRDHETLSTRTYDQPLPHDTPHITVVIAGKNEEFHIEACVRTLLAQDHPNFDIVMVNDRSSDRTGDILSRLKEEHPDKITVETIEYLPEDWYGKTHALVHGVRKAKGDYLLFSDADCDFAPNALSTAVRHAIENDVECLTLTPVIRTVCTAEGIIQPVCTAVLFLWHPPLRVNDPKSKATYANGAFILFERHAYERIGGHESVRYVMLEDIAIARVAKSAGVRLKVVQNEDLYVTEMYENYGAVHRGWSRIFQGSFLTAGKTALGLIVLFLFSLLPWLSAIASTVGWLLADAETAPMWQKLALMWWIAVLLAQSVVWRFYPLMHAPAIRSLTYPIGVLATALILCDTFFKTLGINKTKWGDHRPTTSSTPPTSEPIANVD